MTLLNPWALAGLALLAIPILAHLMARRRTRVLPFPTLRFIAPSRLRPVRTLRLTDPLLLALRCAIVAAAALALAQPRFRTAAPGQAAANVLARAIVVDTSTSMRAPAAVPSALAAARQEAARSAGEAGVSITVESADPAAELRGSAEWLRHQPGEREIVLISDFQLGVIDSTDVAALPQEIGLRLVRVPATRHALPAERIGDLEVTAQAAVADGSTTATWSLAESREPAAGTVRLLAGGDDGGLARATLAAVGTFAAPPGDTARGVAIVFPSHPQRAELERRAGPPDARWMADVLASVRDPGHLAGAGVAPIDGRERLLLFTDVAAGSVAAAELTLAAANALSERTPGFEREPARIPDAQLETWRRTPGAVVLPDDETGGSDGRWLWLLALALLAAETAVRRRQEAQPLDEVREGEEERHARVA